MHDERSDPVGAVTAPESPIAIHLRMRPLRMLAAELEASDPYTSGHSRRVARYATLVGSQLGLTPGAFRRLRSAAMLHDVGKISIDRAILDKPGPLTDDEYAVIRSHSACGADMIDDLVGDRRLSQIVRHHHERFDGTGYPDGLVGYDIPLGARLIAVADTFDAVASRRPYRRARSFDEALDELLAASGSQLDPEIVDIFCSVSAALPVMGAPDLLSNPVEGLVRRAPWHPDPVRPVVQRPRLVAASGR